MCSILDLNGFCMRCSALRICAIRVSRESGVNIWVYMAFLFKLPFPRESLLVGHWASLSLTACGGSFTKCRCGLKRYFLIKCAASTDQNHKKSIRNSVFFIPSVDSSLRTILFVGRCTAFLSMATSHPDIIIIITIRWYLLASFGC